MVVFNEKEAEVLGIRPEDRVNLNLPGEDLVAIADLSKTAVSSGEVGLFEEIWKKVGIKTGEIVNLSLLSRPPSVEAIKKKLLGAPLNYEEIYSIVKDLSEGRIGDIEATYFVATGFTRNWSDQELYSLVKAMAETGEKLEFSGKVGDIHSVGGIPGNRSTMIAGPLASCLGLVVPKTSSRAITSPSGVADTMEVFAEVALSAKKLKEVAQKVGATLAWGGGLNLAPADDKIVKLSYPLAMEPYSKMIVSILAKKVAMGIKYLVLEMPIGETAKIPNIYVAKFLEKRFVKLGRRFGIKIRVVKLPLVEPIGHGIGPALEARDVLRIFQHKDERSHGLERNAIHLAAHLLELADLYSYQTAIRLVRDILHSGEGLKTFQEIIKAQGPHLSLQIDSEEIVKGTFTKDVKANKTGQIREVNLQALNELARILGAPHDKLAGVYVERRIREKVSQGERLMILHAESKERLILGEKSLEKLEVYEY